MQYILTLLFIFYSILSFGQVFVKGKILDMETLQPVIGASIYLQNKNEIGTICSINGNFTLKIPAYYQTDSLVISCINYETVKYPIDAFKFGKTVYLKTDIKKIAEVRVIKDQGAKLVLKKAFRRYFKNVYYGWYTANINQSNVVYDSTRCIIDAVKINGSIESANFNALKDTITPNQGNPTFLISDFYKTSGFNIEYYQGSMHIIPQKQFPYIYNPGIASEIMRNHVFLTSSYPELYFGFYYSDFNCHVDFVEKEAFCNERKVWVVSAKDITMLNYDYKLPENEFRNKYKKDLKQFKESINYSPGNPVYPLSERQIDSLYFSNLRKKMKLGKSTMHQIVFYIDKETYAIHRMDIKIASHVPDSQEYFTKLIYYYKDLPLHNNKTRKVLNKLEILSNCKFDNRYTNTLYTLFELDDYVFKRKISTDFYPCKDSIQTFCSDSFNLYIDDWETVLLSPIFQENDLFTKLDD